jgi:ATP-binding cassette subfamily C (CFTR/MRP) protein 1
VPATMIATLALTVAALMVESVKRSAEAEPDKQQYSPEQYSGFWNRAIWAWLAATFRLGYAKVISVDDLPHLDSKLESHQVHHKLLSTWDKCKARTVMLN